MAKQNRFKVGDKVKVTKDSVYSLQCTGVYTVTNIEYDNIEEQTWIWTDSKDRLSIFLYHMLEAAYQPGEQLLFEFMREENV